MRRLVQILSLALTGLIVTAVPAFAAEEATSDGFGSGMWDGLLLAAVFGVIMGLALFLDTESRGEGHDDVH